MRCNNCGWDNADNATKCQMCGSILNHSGHSDRSQKEESNNDGIKKTRRGASPLDPILDKQEADPRMASTEKGLNGASLCCPSCGYPLLAGTKVCPHCHFNLVYNELEDERQLKVNELPTKKSINATIDPYAKKEFKFFLLPVFNKEEPETMKLEFAGPRVVLNRKTLETEKLSITSKAQAIICFKKDHWCIEDKSDLKTTFIYVARETLLQKGDIILLGDQKYVFEY